MYPNDIILCGSMNVTLSCHDNLLGAGFKRVAKDHVALHTCKKEKTETVEQEKLENTDSLEEIRKLMKPIGKTSGIHNSGKSVTFACML